MIKKYRKKPGRYLQQRRIALGLTQKDLSAHINLPVSVISEVERCIQPVPMKMIKAWCKFILARQETLIDLMAEDYKQGLLKDD